MKRAFVSSLFFGSLACPAALAGGSKITICHTTSSAKNPVVTIEVSERAWAAHEAHGDTLPELWYADADGDGYGDDDDVVEDCVQPSGFVADSGDCDDADAEVSPGAWEVCNDVDDDCNEAVDDLDARLITSRKTGITEIDLDDLSSTVLYSPASWGVNHSIAGSPDHTTVHAITVAGDFYTADWDAETDAQLDNVGIYNGCGLSYGDSEDEVYALSRALDALVRYDVADGSWSEVGALGFDVRGCGLTYRPDDGWFYGVNVNPGTGEGSIWQIDPVSGAGVSELALDPSVSWSGGAIAYSCETKSFMVYHSSGVMEVDPDTGLVLQSYAVGVGSALAFTAR